MNNSFIILAAGESKRFKSKTPKPYYLYRGKPLFLHSIDKAKESNRFKKIILVINNKHKKLLQNIRLKNVKIINGGKNRSESSLKALKSIKNNKISKVFIHDAARPNFSLKLISNLFKGLKKNKCVVPVLKTSNSVKLKERNKLKNIDRNKIYLTQTPQAFHYKTLLNLQKRTTSKITDDANLFIEANKKVKFVNGEFGNSKITIKSDVIDKNNFQNLDKLVKNNNFVINCLPLNNSTKECFKLSTFTSMSSYSYFINVGRGETVNEKDLFYVLDNNLIRGAFLDVVQDEPIKKDNQLLYLDNIFISPHIANFSKKSQDIQIIDFIFNLLRYNQNKPLLNVVYNSIGEKI